MDKRYDVFNLGTGKGHSVLEIVNIFSTILKYEIPYKIIDRRKGDSAEIYADCSKANKILGWKAERSLAEMVSDCLRFLKLNSDFELNKNLESYEK